MRKSLALKNRYLQQVEWAVFSPSLMAKPAPANYLRDEEHEKSVIQLLLRLDQNPSEVDQHFQSLRHMPMGKYFEQLVFFILKHDNRFELLLANHQIKEGDRTIGELDVIVRDIRTGKREHWEIALKFYLQSDSSPEQEKIFGPNAVDNLGRKMEKLINRQMPLSTHSSIKYLVGSEKTESKLFMKGQIFYHLGNYSILPKTTNPNHEKHWWCFVSEVDNMVSGDLNWYALEKPNWIGPYVSEGKEPWMSSSEMKQYLITEIEKNGKPQLIVAIFEAENGWREHTRGFVVANDWQNIKAQN